MELEDYIQEEYKNKNKVNKFDLLREVVTATIVVIFIILITYFN